MRLTDLLLHFVRARPILVVDDDPVVRDHARLVLGQIGLELELCPDGRTALAAFQQRRGAYAFVLLDLRMPGLGGVELCRILRETAPDTPVLLYTAVPRWRVDPALFSAGGVGHLCKPVDPEAIALELARMGLTTAPV